MIWRVLGKITRPNVGAGVDPEDTYSYIGSTYLARFWGNFWISFSSERGRTGGMSLSPSNHPQADFYPRRTGISLLQGAPQRRLRQAVRNFHDLRDDSMTLYEGIRRNLPHRDTRIPNRSALFLSPRHKQKNNQKSRDLLGRTSHGVARATESLRELRLSLVPRFEPRKCLLPTV